MIVWYTVIAVAVLAVAFLLATFNRLVGLRNGVRGAWSDIDGDAIPSSVCMWRNLVDNTGNEVTAAPNCPTIAKADTTVCGGVTKPASIGFGQVTTCSADNVF